MVRKNCRGSLTIEACLVIPLFLISFFLLLFAVQAATISITLDHAVKETAKELVGRAYPLSFLNELEDEILPSDGSANQDSLLQDYLTGELGQSLLNIGGRELKSFLLRELSPSFYQLKRAGKYRVAEILLQKHLANTQVRIENIRIRQVELPQSQREYSLTLEEAGQEASGRLLLTGRDYGKDDVVLLLEYHLQVPFPIPGPPELIMGFRAVEKAWLHGSSGVYTVQGDKGIDELESPAAIVYHTRTGTKYHRGTCWYLHSSKIAISLQEAQKRFEPCKICHPPLETVQ